MVGRCTRPKHGAYARYGAVGITVCARWLTFTNFLVDMGERPKGCTIDRIKGVTEYAPGNCRWATIFEQQQNTKSNVNLTFDGRTMCLNAWAREVGCNAKTLAYRLKNGWGDRAFTEKPKLGNRVKKALEDTRRAQERGA